MGDRKQAVRDQAIAAVGSLVGGALGTLGGPEVALTGAAAGSVGALLAAKYAPEFFQNTIWQRYQNNRRIISLLRDKIASDFAYSFLASQGTFNQAMSSASRKGASVFLEAGALERLGRSETGRFRVLTTSANPVPALKRATPSPRRAKRS